MMHYWNDGYNAWWWMIPMMVFMLAVVGTVVWALVHTTRPEPGTSPKTPSPEEVLAQRLAAGEIDAAEYHERLDALHGRARQSG
jgi:putative membrane protein